MGDARADFGAFVEARIGALLRYAHVLTGDRHRAEDLVQSALASSYRHWRRIDHNDVERYVRKAILNGHLSWWRNRGRTRASSVEDVALYADAHNPDAPADAGLDLRDELWRQLADLPPRQRAVIVLRYYEDLTEAETAARMQTSVGTVKSQHAKALRTLRAAMAERDSRQHPTQSSPTSGGAR
jgi:RNA polymerase sigma-70 factor (sigma-E family)